TVVGLTKVELVKSDLTSTIYETNVKLEVMPVGKNQPVTFNDLDGHWAKQEVGRAAGLGFVNGYTDSSFRPQNNVTRAEFTAMIARALELKSTSGAALDFADMDRFPDWAKPF